MGKSGKAKKKLERRLRKQENDSYYIEKKLLNANIPKVTIIINGKRCNEPILNRILKECQTPLFYHKFTVHKTASYERNYILKSIMDFVYPSSLMPVHFFQKKNYVYFLARNCQEVIIKLINNGCKVPHPLDPKIPFKITIFANCIISEEVSVEDNSKNIQEVIEKRFNEASKLLDLNNFSNDIDLNEYVPLFNNKFFQYVINEALPKSPKILDLQNNYLRNISSISTIKSCVEILDLSNNEIEDINVLSALTEFENLKSLNLSGNPVCNNYNSWNYVINVKKFCPNLEILDNVDVVIPKFQKNFVCTTEAEDFAAQFIQYYFSRYDCNRMSLRDVYDPFAIFSVNAKINSKQANSRWVRLDHYGLENPFTIYGIIDIMKLFSEFPRSCHDPYPTVCDVLLYTDTHVHIVTSGIFKENKQILSFNRSFYLKRMGDMFLITNEQLHVCNALDYQKGWSFRFPANVYYSDCPLPYFLDQYKKLEDVFLKLTNMNQQYCQKYLVYCNYDLKKALNLFSELYIKSEVPEEAFLTDSDTTSNKMVPVICEDLFKKITTKHNASLNITSKSVWEILNSERMESSSESPINRDLSINRIFKSSCTFIQQNSLSDIKLNLMQKDIIWNEFDIVSEKEDLNRTSKQKNRNLVRFSLEDGKHISTRDNITVKPININNEREQNVLQIPDTTFSNIYARHSPTFSYTYDQKVNKNSNSNEFDIVTDLESKSSNTIFNHSEKPKNLKHNSKQIKRKIVKFNIEDKKNISKKGSITFNPTTSNNNDQKFNKNTNSDEFDIISNLEANASKTTLNRLEKNKGLKRSSKEENRNLVKINLESNKKPISKEAITVKPFISHTEKEQNELPMPVTTFANTYPSHTPIFSYSYDKRFNNPYQVLQSSSTSTSNIYQIAPTSKNIHHIKDQNKKNISLTNINKSTSTTPTSNAPQNAEEISKYKEMALQTMKEFREKIKLINTSNPTTKEEKEVKLNYGNSTNKTNKTKEVTEKSKEEKNTDNLPTKLHISIRQEIQNETRLEIKQDLKSRDSLADTDSIPKAKRIKLEEKESPTQKQVIVKNDPLKAESDNKHAPQDTSQDIGDVKQCKRAIKHLDLSKIREKLQKQKEKLIFIKNKLDETLHNKIKDVDSTLNKPNAKKEELIKKLRAKLQEEKVTLLQYKAELDRHPELFKPNKK